MRFVMPMVVRGVARLLDYPDLLPDPPSGRLQRDTAHPRSDQAGDPTSDRRVNSSLGRDPRGAGARFSSDTDETTRRPRRAAATAGQATRQRHAARRRGSAAAEAARQTRSGQAARASIGGQASAAALRARRRGSGRIQAAWSARRPGAAGSTAARQRGLRGDQAARQRGGPGGAACACDQAARLVAAARGSASPRGGFEVRRTVRRTNRRPASRTGGPRQDAEPGPREGPRFEEWTRRRLAVLALVDDDRDEMITPLTTCWQNGETFRRSRPLLMTPMISAPTIVPQTVPMPPAKLVPPMTAEAMASNS